MDRTLTSWVYLGSSSINFAFSVLVQLISLLFMLSLVRLLRFIKRLQIYCHMAPPDKSFHTDASLLA